MEDWSVDLWDDSGGGPLQAARAAFRGEMPPRYAPGFWDGAFKAEVDRHVSPGMQILDVGAGARPTLPPADRPAGSHYVGMDISAEELERAESGSYDELVVADLRHPTESLQHRFDLAVSWLVLEHVKPLQAALDNVRSYLRPGGHLIAQMPGRFSPFSLLNRVIPHRLAVGALRRTQKRDPDSVFPAYYDRCWQSALMALLSEGWSESNVTALFTGAAYVRFSRPLTAAYIMYEEWACRHDRYNLAAYYLISARA